MSIRSIQTHQKGLVIGMASPVLDGVEKEGRSALQ